MIVLEDNEFFNDEEYIEARKTKVKFRKYISIYELVNKFTRNSFWIVNEQMINNNDEAIKNNRINEQWLNKYQNSVSDINSIGIKKRGWHGWDFKEVDSYV